MAKILILGPGQWWDEPDGPQSPTPLEIRRRMKEILRPRHEAVILEDQPAESSLSQKFARILDDPRLTDAVIYWPPRSKMVTTQQEIAILVARRPARLRIWLLHHTSVASIKQGVFEVTQHGDRGRYTSDLMALSPRVLPWSDERELETHVRHLKSVLV